MELYNLNYIYMYTYIYIFNMYRLYRDIEWYRDIYVWNNHVGQYGFLQIRLHHGATMALHPRWSARKA